MANRAIRLTREQLKAIINEEMERDLDLKNVAQQVCDAVGQGSIDIDSSDSSVRMVGVDMYEFNMQKYIDDEVPGQGRRGRRPRGFVSYRVVISATKETYDD